MNWCHENCKKESIRLYGDNSDESQSDFIGICEETCNEKNNCKYQHLDYSLQQYYNLNLNIVGNSEIIKKIIIKEIKINENYGI